MNRVRWRIGVASAVVIAVVGVVFAIGLPQRSSFLASAAPNACRLLAEGSPFGNVVSCLPLGRRTPPFAHPDGTAFALLETDTGPAAVRVDYTNTRNGNRFIAHAVEIQPWTAPGISHETSERLKEAITGRGGLHSNDWVLSH